MKKTLLLSLLAVAVTVVNAMAAQLPNSAVFKLESNYNNGFVMDKISDGVFNVKAQLDRYFYAAWFEFDGDAKFCAIANVNEVSEPCETGLVYDNYGDFNIDSGYWDITIDMNTMTAKFDWYDPTTEPDPTPSIAQLWCIGIGSVLPADVNHMNTGDGVIYTLADVKLTPSTRFIISDYEGYSVNFGVAKAGDTVPFNTSYLLTYGGEQISVASDFEGNIEFNLEAQTIRLIGSEPEEFTADMYFCHEGDLAGHYAMKMVSPGVYQTQVTLERFYYSAWFETADEMGYCLTDDADVLEPGTYAVVRDDASWFSIEAGTWDITLDLNTMLATFAEGTPGALNDVDIFDAAAPSEYFNLQGIRVAEPQNGIFIRRQGSKTAKIAL